MSEPPVRGVRAALRGQLGVLACGLLLLALGAPRLAHAQAEAAQPPAPAQESQAAPARPSQSQEAPGGCGTGPTWLGQAPPEQPHIGVGAAIGVLNLPNLGAGVTVLAQFGDALPMDLSLTHYFENTSDLITSERDLGLTPRAVVPWPPGGSHVSFTLTQLNFAMCPARHDLDPGTLLGCAGVYGGLITAEGDGFVDAQDILRVALGLEAYARWRYRLGGPIGLTYSAGLFVPLLRPGFGYVDGYGRFQEQFRVSPLGGRLDVALTYSFE